MSQLSLTAYTDSSMNQWYDQIKPFTPASKFLHVSEQDYQVLRALQYDTLSQDDAYLTETHTRPITNMTKDEEINHIQIIENKLDELFDSKEKFFRTDIFSPKDAGSCIVKTGKEIINLIAHSSRLFYDLPKIKQTPGISLVLRDVIFYQDEYRIFIKDANIQGISQSLDSDIINYKLILNNDEYKQIDDAKIQKVQEYATYLINECHLQDVVLDVGIDNDNNYYAIEINPYCTTTDKCLLSSIDLQENQLYIAYNLDREHIIIKSYSTNDYDETIIPLTYKDKFQYTQDKVSKLKHILSELNNVCPELLQNI